MKFISDSLKTILNGLAYKDAGEHLNRKQKHSLLKDMSLNPLQQQSDTASSVLVLTTIDNAAEVLDYAIDFCIRQRASLDLMTLGHTHPQTLHIIVQALVSSGLRYHHRHLRQHPLKNIQQRLDQRPQPRFIIADPDAEPVDQLINDVLPDRNQQFQIPIILIAEQNSHPSLSISAA